MIGINTAIASGAESIGFAISINSIRDEITQALSGVAVPFIGVTTVANSAERASRYRLVTSEGLIVTSVLPTGPASNAGLTAGDIILAINGTGADVEVDLAAAVETAAAGTTINRSIQRGRQTGDVEVAVAEW